MKIKQAELQNLLVEPGYISLKDFVAARDSSKNVEELIDGLIKKGLIKDEEFGQLIAQKINFPFINLREEKIDEKVLHMIPEPLARAKDIILFAYDKNGARVAMNNPDDLEIRHSLSKLIEAPIHIYYATKVDIEKTLWQYKASLKEEMNRILKKLDATELNSVASNKCIMALGGMILMYAQASRASDVHIEPYTDQTVLRFRIDGVMHKIVVFPKKYFSFILTRIKILAKMKTDEHMRAQDGKFQFTINGEHIDIRVSIVPVSGGENIVLRLLTNTNKQISLSDLGFNAKDFKKITSIIRKPHGMILVTGPTGSGKTTTMYEILKKLNTEKVHISTIEDPVEYDIEGVSQIQVNNKAKLTFANGLRAIVRQDPDIIMVGEIRDRETAEIAINSAMTGHLVLSTMHTNNAATALPRLIDMGVEPFLIASTINIVVAQRLLRLICSKCRHTCALSKEDIAMIDIIPGMRSRIEKRYGKKLSKIICYQGAGCSSCSQSGYRGRIGIYEVLELNDKIKKLIVSQSASGDIEKEAKRVGMTTMFADGLDKAMNGLTTINEVIRVIME